MKQIKTITVERIPSYLLEGSWKDALEQINKVKEKIPEEFQDDMKIEIIHEDDYGSNYLYLSIYYSRPETDEELQNRLDSIKDAEERREKYEIESLKILREKYPNV